MSSWMIHIRQKYDGRRFPFDVQVLHKSNVDPVLDVAGTHPDEHVRLLIILAQEHNYTDAVVIKGPAKIC
jgi:hypothetical protein